MIQWKVAKEPSANRSGSERSINQTCIWWWQTLHRDLLMVVTNLTLRLAHDGNKRYIETCSWWWQTLHQDLLMVVTNLTLRLAHDSNERYIGTCSWWWQTLHWACSCWWHPYTETCSWWWQTLPRDLLMVVTNLTLKLAHDGDHLTPRLGQIPAIG